MRLEDNIKLTLHTIKYICETRDDCNGCFFCKKNNDTNCKKNNDTNCCFKVAPAISWDIEDILLSRKEL